MAALVAALALPGCGSTAPGGQHDLPSTEFADRLGIETPPPVTPEEAMAIAAEAARGTATSVDQVQTPNGDMEVEVRASNGAVAEIESAD